MSSESNDHSDQASSSSEQIQSQQVEQVKKHRQFYLNQEILSQRGECYSQLQTLLNPLDQIYRDIKMQVQEREKKPVSDVRLNESSTNYLQTEIFAFSKQSQILYEAYGEPTVVNAALSLRSPKYIVFGTVESVIIAIEIKNGRIDKVQAIFNSGEPQRRYGSVTTIHFSPDQLYMICGFERGDIQVYEVHKKWERISHLHRCMKYPVLTCEFVNYQPGKVDLYEVLCSDTQGMLT